MPLSVTIEIVRGPSKGKRYTLVQETDYTLGRGLQCNPRFPDDEAHQTISRNHCQINIKPNQVMIRDLGSLNGTWVNGQSIGQRPEEPISPPSIGGQLPSVGLKDGDEVRLGNTILTVRLAVSVLCAVCQKEIPEEQIDRSRSRDGRLLCPDCLAVVEKTILVDSPGPVARGKTCVACGRGLAKPLGFIPGADFLCSSCRRDPVEVVQALLKQAEKGEADLAPLQRLTTNRVLGRGAAGAVFLMEEMDTGNLLSLKVLLPEVMANDWAMASFLREIEIGRALNHPNVVRLFASGSYQGLFYYTMEFCDAGSFSQFITERGGIVSVKEAIPIIFQALDGLDYIHNVDLPQVELTDGRLGPRRGLVHRDLKPANIFLTGGQENPVAKIADIGVGKAFDTAGLSGLTRTGSVAGSPVSMPRQQVINFKYAKPDVDVWAMAATLYMALSGAYPRNFTPDQDPFFVVLSTQPVPIRERHPGIPEKLAKVIDLALVDKPEIVFKSAVEFKSALEKALK